MRLVCPNCSAQYEIDGSMIPDGGRDVQCSNCGHTWFELPPAEAFGDLGPEDFDAAPAADDTAEDDEPEQVEAVDRDLEETRIIDAAESDVDDGDDAADSDEDAETEDETEDEDVPSQASAVAAAAAAALADSTPSNAASSAIMTQRRPADAAALDVLREEAERELSQRRAPPSETIETQTDLGLDEIRKRRTPSRALRARMAANGEDDTETSDLEAQPERRVPAGATRLADGIDLPPLPSTEDDEGYQEPQRDLLPDIDEINSTLKPSRKDRAQRGGNGFLFGFLLMLLIAVAMILAYAQAPALAEAFPNAEPTLISYVDRANSFRDWLAALFNG